MDTEKWNSELLSCTHDCAYLFREKISELEHCQRWRRKAIEALIQAAKECEEKLPIEEQRIHVSDIAATLQKILDDPKSLTDSVEHGNE